MGYWSTQTIREQEICTNKEQVSCENQEVCKLILNQCKRRLKKGHYTDLLRYLEYARHQKKLSLDFPSHVEFVEQTRNWLNCLIDQESS